MRFRLLPRLKLQEKIAASQSQGSFS